MEGSYLFLVLLLFP